MSVRAKFRVESVAEVVWGKDVRVVKLAAVGADEIPENQRYHRFTPSGNMEITIDNPAASDQLKVGHYFYIDFTECPDPLAKK